MEIFLIGLISATLRVATPLIFGTLGELFAEKSGIMNLGIEGTMFLGAFIGFAFTSLTDSLWLGFLAAIIVGILSGLLMALLTVWLGVNQHVSGLGTSLLTTGFALFANRIIFGESSGVLPKITPFPLISPFGDIKIIGPIFEQYLLTYIAFALIPVAWWIFNRTSFGLEIKSVGENPEAADSAGINVYITRTKALIIAGGLMGAAGAFLSIAQLGAFTYGIVAGRGWVCIALVIFAHWRSVRVLWGSLIFAGVFALQLRLQNMGFSLPYEAFLALPYLVTIIALAIAGRNAIVPSALLKAYRRE